jgi:hypothetical protein
MQPPTDPTRHPTPTPTTIDLERLEDGHWRATQPGVGLVGRGANPGRAVAHYGELVAETVYESAEPDTGEQGESSRLAGRR